MRTRMVFIAVVAVALVGADDRDVGEIRVGDKGYISVPTKGAQAMTPADEDAYRLFLLAIKTNDRALLDSLFQAKRLMSRTPGPPVEVLSLRDGEDYPLNVPAAFVERKRADGTAARFFIPLQYLRSQDCPLPDGEFRLPLFMYTHIENFVPTAGARVILTNYDTGELFAATDPQDFIDFAYALAAKDRKPTDALLRSGAVFYVAAWTKAVVVDARPRRATRAVAAIRVRLQGKPLDGKEVWVDVNHCDPQQDRGALYHLDIRPYRSLYRKGR